jgi:hypothetical protein
MNQQKTTQIESEESECYDCHEWSYLEKLETVADQYTKELWVCEICGDTRAVVKTIGVCD